jgi:RAD50-interacting protein 1
VLGRTECVANLDSTNSTALDAYTKLRKLLVELEPLQEAADGAAPHLLDHVRSTTQDLRKQIEHVFTTKLDGVLNRMQYPKNAQDGISEPLQDQFSTAVSNLLKLQRPDLEAHERLNDGSRAIQPLVLLPLKILVQPLELGFRYHFESNNVMNRVDRPEFYLKHITERILAKYSDFMEAYIQPILFQEFRETDLGLNYVYIDATSAFITALLPMVRTKTLALLPQVSKKPSLLSHLIHELMKFDTELRDDWQYDGGSRTEAWFGVAGEILSTDNTFTQWLKAEKDCSYIITRMKTFTNLLSCSISI